MSVFRKIFVSSELSVQCNDCDVVSLKPMNSGKNGQVLTSNGEGKMFFKDLDEKNNNIDFSSIVSEEIKVNLSDKKNQAIFGLVCKHVSVSNLKAGQPVIYYCEDNTKVSEIGTLPAQRDIAGINLNDVEAGEVAFIMMKGYVNARYSNISIINPQTVLLTDETNGIKKMLTNEIYFTNNTGGYKVGKNYSITFDAGLGKTIQFTVNDFYFNHSETDMSNRLGIQVSSDGIHYNNISIQWLQRSSNPFPLWSNSFYKDNWSDEQSCNGYIFPSNKERAIQLGGVSSDSFPEQLIIGSRYIRFYFQYNNPESDVSWNIKLHPNVLYSDSDSFLPRDSDVYLDSKDYTKTTLDGTSQIKLGKAISIENENILISVF